MDLKPSWDTAPEWARYLAMDETGRWYWFQDKPKCAPGQWAPGITKFYPAKCPNWQTTLEEKP